MHRTNVAMRRRLGRLGLLAIWVIILAPGMSPGLNAFEPVREIPPPKNWDHFVILVWQYQTNVIHDKALYESVNIHGFHIDRRSAALQAFARETGWPFYVDHTADKGYLHLGRNAGPVLRKKQIIVRPNSLADPKTIATLKRFIRQNVTSARGSSVLAYALDDEISLGSFCSPAEVDGHPLSVAGYKKFLRKMYRTIAKLNAQYGTTFGNFGEIEPQSFESFRKQLAPRRIGELNLSRWCDWRSYMDTQFAAVLADLVRYANSLDPSTPAGFVGGQSPNAWGGYDYSKLARAVQWMEAYDIGASNEILRSFWGQARPRMQTYFPKKGPKLDIWFLWYYLCHGNRGVILWPAGVFKNGKVSENVKACAAAYREVQGPLSKKIIDGEFLSDPVAIYYSQPSIQMTWALDAACHRGTWPNRSSSMDANLSTSNLTRIGWIKTLEDIGIQAKFIDGEDLLAGALRRDHCKVLLLNRTLCLSDAEASAIKAFSASGGAVIADHLCGIFDEHGKARPRGSLDDLFGIRHDLSQGILGGNTLTEVNGEKDYKGLSRRSWDVEGAAVWKKMAVIERGLSAQGSARYEKTEAGGAPVVIRNRKAAYLNISPIGYLLQRGKKDSRPWLAFVKGLLREAGVAPRLDVSVEGGAGPIVEPIFWRNGKTVTLCIIANLDRKASVSSFGSTRGKLGEDTVKLRLRFARPVKDLRNERTGAMLGNGRDFQDAFVPYEANVYTYHK